MSDFQRRGGQVDEDDDRLPWLEPVDDYVEDEGISMVRLIGAVVVGLVALGLVIGGIFWLRNRDGAGGDGSLIAAAEGPYKEKPEQPGGMAVEGTGDVAYEASVGKDVNSTIDLSAVPEAPVTDATPPPAVPATVPTTAVASSRHVETPAPTKIASAPAPSRPAPVSDAPASQKAATPRVAPPAVAMSGGGSVQLGAFSSEALANKAWKQLAGRFSFLNGLDHQVASVAVGGKTLYRLRAAAGGQASTLCGKLKVAGEACTVVN